MRTCRSRGQRHKEHSCGRRREKANAWPLLVSLIALGAVLATGSCAFATCSVCTGAGSINRNDGNTNFQNGSTLQAGFAVSISGTHPATTLTVTGTATFLYICNGVPGALTVQLAGTYTIPAGSSSWYPSSSQSDPATYQGSVTLPNCGLNGVSIGYSGSTETFVFTVTADQSVTVNVRWHYRGTRKSNGSLTAGAWSGTLPVSLSCSPCAPAIDVAKAASVTTAHVGDAITYTYTVTNTGNVRLTGLGVTDSRLGAIGLGTTALGPGDSTTGSAQYVVVAGDLPGPLVNTATATGTPPSGGAVTDSSASVSVPLVPTLSLQIVSGPSASFSAITGPGRYDAQGGTTLRVTSDRAGWTLSQSLAFSVPPGADTGTVGRVFQVAYGSYTAQAGTTDVPVSYTLVIAATDFAGLPQGDYLITVTYTVTSGG